MVKYALRSNVLFHLAGHANKHNFHNAENGDIVKLENASKRKNFSNHAVKITNARRRKSIYAKKI